MACYAEIENGMVAQVIVIDPSLVGTLSGTWIETDPNTRSGEHCDANGTPDGGVALRGNYAGVGYIYDAANEVFYPSRPFPSWSIAAPKWTWTPPVPEPTGGGPYIWDEASQSWQVRSV